MSRCWGSQAKHFICNSRRELWPPVNAGVHDHDTLVAIALGEVGLEGSEADGDVAATLADLEKK
jgi:hypothetical protein